MSLNVLLPKFEGPLGLLLYLIRKEEMSIMDINIHEITKQYLDYIKLLKELDLELASDFIFMASTLIQIKSKMLLPQYNEEGEIIETEDPRKELVQRLLDYQKFQEAAKKLNELSWLGRNVWARGMPQDFETGDSHSDVIIEENGLFQMISAYRKMMRSVKNKVHQVAEKVQSIASRILEIKDRLIVGHRVLLTELLNATEGRSRQLLITFLSLLELGKLGLVHLYQTEAYSDLWVEARRTIETDVISHVEEYSHVQMAPRLNFEAAFNGETSTDRDVTLDKEASLASDENDENYDIYAKEDFRDESSIENEDMLEPLDSMASDDDILNAEKELQDHRVELEPTEGEGQV